MCLCSWYRVEIWYYSNFAKRLPIKSATMYAAFMDEHTGRHCLVLEDCMAMPGGEVTSYPMWMLGVEEEFLTGMVCDLARMHGECANSPMLASVKKPDDVPEWLQAEFRKDPKMFCPAIIGMIVDHWSPVSAAEAQIVGCAAGAPNHEAFRAIFRNHNDKLKFEMPIQGVTYSLSDADNMPGMWGQGSWLMAGDTGKQLLIAIMKKFGSRKVQTVIHGDGHPGNVFYQAATKTFTWIGAQLHGVCCSRTVLLSLCANSCDQC
eukprot:SAG31_NODE_6467_length_2006_cov_1.609334_2_plen_262_part_00